MASTYTITINTVARKILPGFSITETANGRNTMSCSILSPSYSDENAAVFQVGAEVIVEEDGTRIFGGNISAPATKGLGGESGNQIVTDISLSDFNALADKRYVSMEIPAGTLKAALLAIQAAGFFPAGVTLDAGQIPGPNIPALSYRNYQDRCKLSSVLNEIAVIDPTYKFTWNIDYFKKLKFTIPADSHATPYSIDAQYDRYVIGDVSVEPSNDNYANRIFLLFDAIDKPRASQAFFKVTSGNFADGTTVTVGATYTFKTTLSNTAGYVLIGADAEASLTNLVAAINLAGGAGTVYAVATTANPSIYAYMGNFGSTAAMRVRAIETGASGNSIAVSATEPDAVWFGEGNEVLTTMQLGSDEVTLVAFVKAEHSSAATNPIERTLTIPGLTDPIIAQALANAALIKSMSVPKKIQYTTFEKGVHPGLSQFLDIPRRGIWGFYLITDVTIRNAQSGITVREVTAIEGTNLADSWRDSPMWGGGGGSSDGGGSYSLLVTSGGGGGGTGGGVMPGSGVSTVELGGSRQYGYVSATYIDAPDYNDKVLNLQPSQTARFRCHQKTTDAGTAVQVRVVAVDANGAVLQVCAESPASTNTSWGYGEAGHYVDVLFTPRAGGNAYRLQIKGSNANADVWVAGAHLTWY